MSLQKVAHWTSSKNCRIKEYQRDVQQKKNVETSALAEHLSQGIGQVINFDGIKVEARINQYEQRIIREIMRKPDNFS